MFRRREAVPFSFVAEADRFRSNVTPPPRRRPSGSQLAGHTLIGLTIVCGLVGSLLFGLPALESEPVAGAFAAVRRRPTAGDSLRAPLGWSGSGPLGSLTGHSPTECAGE